MSMIPTKDQQIEALEQENQGLKQEIARLQALLEREAPHIPPSRVYRPARA